MPVGVGDCVMNRICRKVEERFDGYLRRPGSGGAFDYELLKSGAEYTKSQYRSIQQLYKSYNRRIAGLITFSGYERIDDDEVAALKADMRDEFVRECLSVCSNGVTLCDIIVDICYKKNQTKGFAWDICGKEIVNNLLSRHDGIIQFPKQNSDGDIEYCGERFSMVSVSVGVDE
jgi:hypothetical protein